MQDIEEVMDLCRYLLIFFAWISMQVELGVAPIADKMREHRLRWEGHVLEDQSMQS